jgi:predicted nucleic acid-binding protein
MKTAVDTSVLLDVLAGDSTFGPASREALRRAYDSGSLLASDVVWSEVRAHFESDGAFDAAMEKLGIQYVPLSREAARLAGMHWRKYHQDRSRPRSSADDRKRVIADFLIGAHAQVQADALLARDRGFFRVYFRQLNLIEP